MKLTVGWLYPDLMSTYGDRGNILCLQKRCEWRGIDFEVLPINHETKIDELKSIDLLFGGGAQDHEQEIVMKDLRKKGKVIKELIDENLPALFVCGSPQLMGKYYEPAKGKRIKGLEIFDMISVHPGPNELRLIGNIAAKTDSSLFKTDFIVGFENHGGRTYLGEKARPFAKVIKGYGNNGEDQTEGVVYKNAIGCYFHGPLLAKNPEIADYLIKISLERKYKKIIKLEKLNDSLEYKAKTAIAKRLSFDS